MKQGLPIACLLLVCCLAVSHSHVDPLADHVCELMDTDVQDALREDLLKHNCMKEVEIVSPDQVDRAARLFHRDGFVAVKDILTPELIESVKGRCTKMAEEILEKDPKQIGNRGPRRYSMGPPHKTGHIIHYPEIAQLVDLPVMNALLKGIFGNDKYVLRGARGDFNLPGAPYQVMHSDTWDDWLKDPATTEFPDSGRLDYRDLPTLHVVANFVLADLTAINAPIRQIPMTQNSHRVMPMLDDEPLWMKRSTLCPVPAGTVVFRDPRAWHGGTPNLSDGIRLMPNLEYYAYWFRYHDNGQMSRSMPREIYDTLSPYGQHISREIVALPGEEIDTSMKETIPIIYGDVLPCYYKMGLTDADIDEFKNKKAYFDYTKVQGHKRMGFYGRKYGDTTGGNSKDEL